MTVVSVKPRAPTPIGVSPAGPAGKGWVFGSGAPLDSIGRAGDMYLDTDPEGVFNAYGPKPGSSWVGAQICPLGAESAAAAAAKDAAEVAAELAAQRAQDAEDSRASAAGSASAANASKNAASSSASAAAGSASTAATKAGEAAASAEAADDAADAAEEAKDAAQVSAGQASDSADAAAGSATAAGNSASAAAGAADTAVGAKDIAVTKAGEASTSAGQAAASAAAADDSADAVAASAAAAGNKIAGPASAVDGHVVVFDGVTGKQARSAGAPPFSGNYPDLANKPTLGTAASKNTGTAAGNVPLLDGSGKLDTAILPAIAVTDVFVVASHAAMLALSAQRGDVAIRTDVPKTFILSTENPGTLADWKELPVPSDLVQSVAGLAGTISATALKNALAIVIADVSGLQTALDAKLPVANPTSTGKLTTAASAASAAGFRLPHGAAPSAPVDGDAWTTTAGIFIRVNGATIGPLAAAGAGGALTNVSTTSTVTPASGDTVHATGGSPTVNLPTSPAAGATVRVLRNGASGLTVGRNGSTIAGSAADYIMDVDKRQAEFLYSGSTWIVSGGRIA